ncbi:MAG: phosphate ABC transporter substrate-binding protein [Bacillota bacterium]
MFLVALGLILAMTLAGCGQTAQDKEPAGGNESKLSGSITVAGSTSVQPLSEELAEAFNKIQPDVTINVQGGGSSQGVKAAETGIAQIGASSRNLKESEMGLGLDTHKIAIDGIAIVVHPSNNIEDITLEQVRKVFSGEITTWEELGGAGGEISVVTREEGSGTRGAFEEMVMGEDKISNKAVTQPSNGGIRSSVSIDPKAIGYLSTGYVDNSVKGIKIEGVEPNMETIRDGSYKVARPFLYLTKGEVDEVTQAFIDFVLSKEGQDIVAEHYIRVD